MVNKVEHNEMQDSLDGIFEENLSPKSKKFMRVEIQPDHVIRDLGHKAANDSFEAVDKTLQLITNHKDAGAILIFTITQLTRMAIAHLVTDYALQNHPSTLNNDFAIKVGKSTMVKISELVESELSDPDLIEYMKHLSSKNLARGLASKQTDT